MPYHKSLVEVLATKDKIIKRFFLRRQYQTNEVKSSGWNDEPPFGDTNLIGETLPTSSNPSNRNDLRTNPLYPKTNKDKLKNSNKGDSGCCFCIEGSCECGELCEGIESCCSCNVCELIGSCCNSLCELLGSCCNPLGALCDGLCQCLNGCNCECSD